MQEQRMKQHATSDHQWVMVDTVWERKDEETAVTTVLWACHCGAFKTTTQKGD